MFKQKNDGSADISHPVCAGTLHVSVHPDVEACVGIFPGGPFIQVNAYIC